MNNSLSTFNKESVLKIQDPFVVWTKYTLVMAGLLSVTLLRSMIEGIASDGSYISAVILAAFLLAFAFSYFLALSLRAEWRGLLRLNDGTGTAEANSDAERLAGLIINHPQRGQIRVKDLVDSYFSSQELPLRTLAVVSGLMVTLGLIGTIIGLIISIGGLENVMQNVGTSGGSIFSGIQVTIKGMAVAFYSTLFGAILGAVILRMLSVSLSNSLVKMSCWLFNYLELLPAAPTSPEALSSAKVAEGFNLLAASIAAAETELRKFTSASLDARLAGIASQLDSYAAALKDIRK